MHAWFLESSVGEERECTRGAFLGNAEERAGVPPTLRDPRPGDSRGQRVH